MTVEERKKDFEKRKMIAKKNKKDLLKIVINFLKMEINKLFLLKQKNIY